MATALTECGAVRGVASGGAASYKSIPYAKPPIGPLRWQPPVRLRPGDGCWSGTLDATTFAPACLQAAKYGKGGPSSEDCLRLHVWSPVRATRQLPVLVWLHGGGLLEGSAFSIQSGFEAVGDRLPTALDAVIVGVEYRLGVAGFLSLDALTARDRRGRSGNYGLLDVIEALRWVQSNVASFGGDAGRVTVGGQSSGGSLVFALLASPLSRGLVHGAISLSGSPRLNSTTAEAAAYWHRQVVHRTRCASMPAAALAHCLLSLNATELLASQPADWHSDVFGWGVFSPTFQYAPLLLIDGEGGVLPHAYIDAAGAPPPSMDVSVPLVVGSTAQEADFAPSEDVRALTRTGFASFLRRRLEPTLGRVFTSKLVAIYAAGDENTPGDAGVLETTASIAVHAKAHVAFDAQRTYSELVADATVVCPNLLLASAWQAARGASSAVYAYRASQTLSHPFCVLRDTRFNPPYCPLYSFHASDMFAWLRPQRTSHFNYNFSRADREYGELINQQFAAVVHGERPPGWSRCHNSTTPLKDALPAGFAVSELRTPDAPMVHGDKAAACRLWLENRWYEKIGLIN